MLNIFLNIIGLICIIASLIYIFKVSKKERHIYEEISTIHENVKDYSFAIENTLNSFEDLIENGLNKIQNPQTSSLYITENRERTSNISKKESGSIEIKETALEMQKEMDDPTKETYEKILELKNLGLSIGEIAKKLNKGIREVEIIIKMWGNIYKDY